MIQPLKWFLLTSVALFGGVGLVYLVFPPILWCLVVVGPLFLLGLRDVCQNSKSLLRNYPIIGHGRYLLESFRPEINQYFVESNSEGMPFSREKRSLVYQRAKKVIDTQPFGTQREVYRVGYEWIGHSMAPKLPLKKVPRVWIGTDQCDQPYHASLLNVSAMSYGSLSGNAIQALNEGARMGDFAHNTGEGGISAYHLKGGDLIWQVGTGYFGCRTLEGIFCPDRFREKSNLPQVKMIEVKLSQGAKPGKGGILPAKKVTREIAEIRGLPMGEDIISPPAHSSFSTPIELLHFLAKLRKLSGGKPVGIKLCLGVEYQFLSLCKAMIKTNLYPDFIAVDGGEGGTGAAPLEFSNSMGAPVHDGLRYVNNALVGFGLRDKTRIIVSGKITSGFHMASKMALGADLYYAARAMMFALGCIQAIRCNTNTCPVGVATQDRWLVRGLVVEKKKYRVQHFQEATIKSFLELIAAAGLSHPNEIRPHHIHRRISMNAVCKYNELFDFLESGELLKEPIPKSFVKDMQRATSERF